MVLTHLDSFPLAPGRCLHCTSVGPGVDLDREIGENVGMALGRAYICDGCLQDAYHLTPESLLNQYKDEAERLTALLAAAEKERDAANEARAELAAAIELVERVKGHEPPDAPEGAAEPKPRQNRKPRAKSGAAA